MDLKEFGNTTWVTKDEIKETTRRGLAFVVGIKTEAVLVKKSFQQPNGSVKETEKAHCRVVLKDGSEKDIEFNKTSVGNIGKEFGFNSKSWVGKRVSLTVLKVPSGDAEAIYAQPVMEDEVLKNAEKN